jgi:CTP:molybdopterin cytidylyltransferase MocA
MLAILILAAGQSSRMRGRDKLLERIDGQPLLAQIATRALATGAPVYVCLPPYSRAREAVVPTNCQLVRIDDAADGMGTTIASSVASLPQDVTAAMIVPADMPDLTAEDFNTMIAAHMTAPHAITRATSHGTPGHPVIFPSHCFKDLKNLSGDQGARRVIAKNSETVHFVELPEKHALTDLDTPEDWAGWRAERRGKET